MKIENVEIPLVLKCCPFEILLSQTNADVKSLIRQALKKYITLMKILLIEVLKPSIALPTHVILTANCF
jgi:hypothetical protein